MKKLFKKAVTVLGSLAMVGATVSGALAATYTDTFNSNSAVVIGANSLDATAAMQVATDLGISALATSTTVEGGEGDLYKFEKTSDNFNVGDDYQNIRSTLYDDQMKNLLADGEYTDSANSDFDYTQKIEMSNPDLILFEDNDYKDDVPSYGIKIDSSSDVLNYTLTFSDDPAYANLKTTDFPLMGKMYYVLNNDSLTKMTLLDSASSTLLSEGETKTLDVDGTSYDVSIAYISSTEVKLTINGEVTNSLSESSTYKLDDGSYVGVKDIMHTTKEGTVSKVEFSIGKGRLILDESAGIKLNDNTIEGLTVDFTNNSAGTTLDSIKIIWKANEDLFVTEDSVVTMPGFETLSLSMNAIEYPAEEEVKVDVSNEVFTLSNFPLKDGAVDIDLYYINETTGNFSGFGGASDKQVLISNNSAATGITYNDSKHDSFIVSWNDTTDSESYLMRATSFITESSVNKTTFQYMKDGEWTTVKENAIPTDIVTLGNLELTVGAINKNDKTVFVNSTQSAVDFDKLYTAEGLAVAIWTEDNIVNSTFADGNISSMRLTFYEENKQDTLGAGGTFYLTLGSGGSTTKTASVTAVTGLTYGPFEVENSDVFKYAESGDLATEVLNDRSDSGAKTATVIYHGSEVVADVFISSADAVVSTSTGAKTVYDTEEAAYAGKNIVVVGGSCINTVAADLLGGSYCGEDFTTATGVGAGEFMFKAYDYSGKVALLVAGYDKDDTVNAVEYLLGGNEVSTDTAADISVHSPTQANTVA